LIGPWLLNRRPPGAPSSAVLDSLLLTIFGATKRE
jgi:hypothetical protein